MNFQPRTNLNFKKIISARRGSALPAALCVSSFQVSGSGSRQGVSGLPCCGVFWLGLPGLCAVPTLLQADRGALVFLSSEVLSISYFGQLEVWCGHALGGLS